LNKELINSALAGAKKIYGPRITQNEVQLQIKQASPNVDQTTGAIRYLLNLGNQQAQYQINQADALSKYRAAGGDPYAFEGWYAKNFPMAQSVGQAAMADNAKPAGKSPQSAQNVPMTNSQGWTLHIDKSGNRAYVSPDGKSYQEIR
ncbi:MAG: hypothetical protein KGL35_19690, partial [Bradyrhizobium sp.]|nr:hypothetical protein [Bradyrhizobium sp.]